MTNEEAKKMLEAKLKCLIAETSGTNHDCNMQLCDGCSLNYEQGNMGEQKEALEMAIKALEQQLRDCKTCKHSDNGNCAGSEECHECMWESKYEQQPSEPRTNLAETSQDCVSIEPIQWYSQNKDGYLVKGAYSKDEAFVKLTDVYEKIRTYKRPKGKWIYQLNRINLPICSECDNPNEFGKEYKFCPNCGAYMRGGGEE